MDFSWTIRAIRAVQFQSLAVRGSAQQFEGGDFMSLVAATVHCPVGLFNNLINSKSTKIRT